MGPSAFADRNLHLKQLADRTRTFQTQSPPTAVVLVGDLNLTPWSPIFTDVEQASRLMRACERFDITPTWYRYPGFPFGLVLDHGLISDRLHCLSHVVGPDIGSDEWQSVIEFKLGIRGQADLPARGSREWCEFIEARLQAK